MDEIISYKMCAVKVRNAKLRNYLKCDCDQIFTSVFFSMIVKNAYKEAATQNFSVISYILPELYDDEVRILAAAIKISHIGKFKCSGVFDVIVSTHAGRAT